MYITIIEGVAPDLNIPRQEGVRQLHILDDSFIFVPLRFRRIGCSEDRSTCVQLTDDAGFGYAKGLLLHHLKATEIQISIFRVWRVPREERSS